eukprot:8632829-Pyramimonas_sp.AAC.1
MAAWSLCIKGMPGSRPMTVCRLCEVCWPPGGPARAWGPGHGEARVPRSATDTGLQGCKRTFFGQPES